MSAHSLQLFAGVAALLAAAAAHATLYEFTLSGDAAVSLNDIIDRPVQDTRLTLSVIADPATSTLRFTNTPSIEATDVRYDTASFSARPVNDPTEPNGLYEYFMPNGHTAMLLEPDRSVFNTTDVVPLDWLGMIDSAVFTGGVARSWAANPSPAPVSLPLQVWRGQGPIPPGSLYAVPTRVRVTVEGGGPLCCFLAYQWTGNALFTAAPIVPEPGTLVTIALGIIAVTARMLRTGARACLGSRLSGVRLETVNANVRSTLLTSGRSKYRVRPAFFCHSNYPNAPRETLKGLSPWAFSRQDFP